MRVLHLAPCASNGGAARFGYRLHRALLAAGVDSTMWVKDKDVDDATVQAVPRGPLATVAAQPSRIAQKLERLKILDKAGFTSDRTTMSGLQLAGIEAFDVVHIHFLAFAFDLPALFSRLKTNQRIVWTLHDANAFTGGCHFFGECERYLASCGACPQLGSTTENDLSRKIHRRKARLYAGHDIIFVGPGRWTSARCAESSIGKPFRNVVIPSAFDTNAFVPIDRIAAKARLGVPADRFVIGWLATWVNDPRKGIDLLLEALAKIDPKKIHLLWGGEGERSLEVPFSQTRLEFIKDHTELLDFYAASDLFAITSRSESNPAVPAEASACGTPSVGFAATGVPDSIASPNLGKLVEPFDVVALAGAIESYRKLSDADYAACREAARTESVKMNDEAVWVQRYIEVYAGPSDPAASRV